MHAQRKAISTAPSTIMARPSNSIPNAWLRFYNRGNAYAKKGDLDRAISDFNEAIDLDLKNAAAFYNRGNAYLEKGDFDRAISDFDDAIKLGFKLDSKDAFVFHNRGTAYQEKGDLEARHQRL